jgi:aspartate 4-decarboxylase
MDDPRSEEKRYETLSPFEVKNKLIELSETRAEAMMLNAGRGNPNWVATRSRHAFYQLGLFALAEAERKGIKPGFGRSPKKDGVAQRFQAFLDSNQAAGTGLLREGLAFVTGELGIDAEAFLFEMVDAILADHYPVPDRMLNNCEKIVAAYLGREMCGGDWPSGAFDLFATEGGTAAMAYVFNSLMENKLLHKGDKIAIGTPVFTPYLEIPLLNDYEFVELDIEQNEDESWQYPASEIEKLADPAVKAFFLVHPSNPTSVAMHPDSLAAIASLVETRRKDLIVLTDDVYGTFVNDFRSLASAAPRNTILVYSFSKYFGATGWRLGVIGLHPDNVLDKAIQALPDADRSELVERYHTVFVDPAGAKLIDRMVADSRTVALHHTAGLSTPQQVMMVLFSLASLVDKDQGYKASAQEIVAERFAELYKSLGIDPPEDKFEARYYTTIDVPRMAVNRYDQAFANWLVKEHEPIDFVWRLAQEKSIVLMDGGGFDAPNMSVRVSLANLTKPDYAAIGKGISDLLDEYHDRFKAAG